MRRSAIIYILWITTIVSANVVFRCLNGNICNHVRVIVANSNDVSEVSDKNSTALEIDFHGNLLSEYQHPTAVQWIKLNLSYNLLTQDIFSNIRSSQLKVVDLTYNQLTTVSVPSSVVEFIVERNKLYDITIPSKNNIQKLILPKNKFDSLRKFTSLPNLLELDLSCNDLDQLNFDLLPLSLETLKISRNHIYVISGSKSLHSLQYLDLSHNLLTMLDEKPKLFPNVQTLYLQNNKLVMVLGVVDPNKKLQKINLHDNDWDCNKLKAILKEIRGTTNIISSSGIDDCEERVQSICCSSSDSPYADRVIKYRKQEFHALTAGVAQRRTSNSSCNTYEPNPCDGDDNLVHKVAKSAVNDAKSIADSNLAELNIILARKEDEFSKLQKNLAEVGMEYNKFSAEHADLVAYIDRQYSEAVPKNNQALRGKPNEEVRKLQDIFNYYGKENENYKQLIDAEERSNQDKLSVIQTLENEMEELNYQKERLTEELNQRNATVQNYKTKIQILQNALRV